MSKSRPPLIAALCLALGACATTSPPPANLPPTPPAWLLVEPSQALLHDRVLDERTILERTAAGLASEGSDFGMAEAGWVVTRLAELLNWPWPGLDALRAEAQAQADARASRLG